MPVLAAFVFGAMAGSFLNVCIFRLPKEESIIFPGSHCRSCGRAIAWFDNIPLVSFFALKGKCRHCSAKISRQYVAVEFLTACVFVVFYQSFGPSVKGGVYLMLTLAILVESAIDFRHRIIPDSITLPGILIGLVLSAIFPELQGETVFWKGLGHSFFGMLLGGGFLYGMGTLAEFILKKEAMGGGDVKLLAMIGACLGVKAVLWTIFVSSLLGSIFGILQRIRGGEEKIPFGPYLGFAAVLYLFIGESVITWYMNSLTSF
ncbi:MAG: hypothetical protein A3C47_04925 [Omnitrophica bacterium RIFCSPHIGHO2_02_FULL_51_18]|nr:MAG: hypothetical protein A3C47_04925 [Omnitrophica bacterium RIFCSPHIGHO2_02_FULL_51_18]